MTFYLNVFFIYLPTIKDVVGYYKFWNEVMVWFMQMIFYNVYIPLQMMWRKIQVLQYFISLIQHVLTIVFFFQLSATGCLPWMPEVVSLASGEKRSVRASSPGRFATRLRGFAAQFCRPQREKNLWHQGTGCLAFLSFRLFRAATLFSFIFAGS